MRKGSPRSPTEPPTAGSFLFPIVTASMAMDDIRSTAGGAIYGNRTKHYAGGLALTAAETVALNKQGDPADRRRRRGLAYMRQWHTASGTFKTPLVAIHNQIDSLVPYSQALGLEAKVAAHGDPKRLVLITVPAVRMAIPGIGATGYIHCGFEPKQLIPRRLGDTAAAHGRRLDRSPGKLSGQASASSNACPGPRVQARSRRGPAQPFLREHALEVGAASKAWLANIGQEAKMSGRLFRRDRDHRELQPPYKRVCDVAHRDAGLADRVVSRAGLSFSSAST